MRKKMKQADGDQSSLSKEEVESKKARFREFLKLMGNKTASSKENK